MQTKDRNNMHVTGRKPRQKSDQPRKEPEVQVQYTAAKPFNRNRFLLHMATVLAVVIAVVLVVSIFFKVDQVLVAGTEKYTPWEVKEAAGIQDGDALLSISEAKIAARVQKKLPYVGDVRVGIKLPDTVNIEIKELEVVYAAEDANGGWWLMDAQGRIVDKTDAAAAKDHTRIVGVKIKPTAVGEQAVASQPEVESSTQPSDAIVATLPPVSAKEQLNSAIQIFTALEKNGVMGVVDSVDVSDLASLSLAYEDRLQVSQGNSPRFQVSLGDSSRMEYKISVMKSTIAELGQYENGYLDVSFTIWPNEVHHSHFDNKIPKK